jgi:anti-sigma factor RsiW
MNETHPSIDQIVDHLHGELSAADDAALRAHLSGCPECDELRKEEAAITESLRAHARATELDVPPRVVARIRAEVARAAHPSLWERLRPVLRPAVLLPAAAAAVLVLYFSLNSRTGSSTPIDAAYYVNEHAALAAKAPFAEDVPPATLTSDDEAR